MPRPRSIARRPRALVESLERRQMMDAAIVNGLSAQYFDNKDFTNLKLTRVDPQINFTWGTASPDPSRCLSHPTAIEQSQL